MQNNETTGLHSPRERITSEGYYSSEETHSNPTDSKMAPPTSPHHGNKSWLCGVCQKPVKDAEGASVCDSCNHYVHGACLQKKLTKAELSAKQEPLSDNFHFYCDDCKASNMNPKSLIAEMRGIREELKEIKAENREMKAENQKLKEENSRLQQRMAELESGSAKMINFNVVFDAIDEHYLRKEKKNNVVIHFLPGDPGDDGDPEQDLNDVKLLAKDAGGNPDHVTEALRMGNPRNDKKPRMLKVKCNNANTKRMLVTGQEKLRKNNTVLRDTGFFIRDDMTDRQREEDKTLRDKLTGLRGVHKDKNLVIRDGKIVEKIGKDVQPFLG